MIDHSELDALARDLALASAKVIPALVPVANRAGVSIKAAMRKDVSGHPRFARLPSLVSYDVEVSPNSVTVEVGFADEGQGELANIAAFGTATTPPIMDIHRGLDEELPRFMRWVAQAGSEAL